MAPVFGVVSCTRKRIFREGARFETEVKVSQGQPHEAVLILYVVLWIDVVCVCFWVSSIAGGGLTRPPFPVWGSFINLFVAW